MVPPWAPPLPSIPPLLPPDDDVQEGDQINPVPLLVAPKGRFGSARRSLGSFGSGGETSAMKRGVGHYIRKGLGGRGMATKRFGGTIKTAGLLHDVLSSLSNGGATPGGLSVDLLRGQTARAIIDAIIDAVRPVDGTLDAEGSRRCINDALSELLELFPDADILNLEPKAREYVMEVYLAQEVFQRFCQDVGEAIGRKAASIVSGLARLEEACAYIRETIAASLRKQSSNPTPISAAAISMMAESTLRDAFEVFESWT